MQVGFKSLLIVRLRSGLRRPGGLRPELRRDSLRVSGTRFDVRDLLAQPKLGEAERRLAGRQGFEPR